MALHEVVHHVNERFVLVLWTVHDGTQHLQDIGAFRVGYVLIGAIRARRDQTQPHPERSCVVRSYPEVILLQNALLQPVPELNVVLPPLSGHGLLQKQPGGEFSKPFREPLIMIGSPAYGMAPPLVGHFMGRYLLHKARKLAVDVSE